MIEDTPTLSQALTELSCKVSDINQLTICMNTMLNNQAKFSIKENVKLDLMQQDINGLRDEIQMIKSVLQLHKRLALTKDND